MSLSSLTNRVQYVGNSTTPIYDYTFRIQDKDDLTVFVYDGAALTTLVIGTDYTVDQASIGAPSGFITLVNSGQAWLSGGNLATGYSIIMRRIPVLTQEADIRNAGDFYPEIHEDEFDHEIMVAQSLKTDIDRCIKLPNCITPGTFDPNLPNNIPAGATICVNPNATGMAFGPTADQVAGAQASAIAAAASASASATSQTAAAASASAASTSATAAAASAAAAASSATATAASAATVVGYMGAGALTQASTTVANGAFNANVTGLAFSSAAARFARVTGAIRRSVTGTELKAMFELYLAYNVVGATWEKLSQDMKGDDDTACVFSVTSAGQVQVTSSTIGGSSYAGTIEFAAMAFA